MDECRCRGGDAGVSWPATAAQGTCAMRSRAKRMLSVLLAAEMNSRV
jgi:hypothetical protein